MSGSDDEPVLSDYLAFLIGRVPELAKEDCATKMRAGLELCRALALLQESELAKARGLLADAHLAQAKAKGGLN